MSKLVWDKDGERLYETGVSEGILFTKTGANGTYATGVAWNGLVSVTEKPTGAEPNPIYADNMKYLNLMSDEEFEATIEAYTYPDAFEQCNGAKELAPGLFVGQQERKEFAFVYKTQIGSDDKGTNKGYKLHIVYGALASPTEKSYETINDSPDAATMSWDITTTPIAVTGANKKTAHLEIDSTKVTNTTGLQSVLDSLYGTDADPEDPSSTGSDPTLLMPDAIATFLKVTGGDTL